MRSLRVAIILAVFAALATLALARPGLAQNAPQMAANLKIISPANGAKISTNFVDVRYQLTNPATAASATPTFQLQLDGGDPVQTASTEFTFTGLPPGAHTVSVEAVDANSTPLVGTQQSVRFTILPQGPKPTTPSSQLNTGAQLREAAMQQDAPAPAPQDALPNTGSALPLLSVIGFGVLLGGIASALKTR
jgi:hypothetical protein